MASSDSATSEHPTISTGLLAGLKSADPVEWSRLVHTFGPIVYRWCRASGIPESDSPDIVQEVFASVARGIGNFQRAKAEGSFRSWLATITRNKARDYFRTRMRMVQGTGGTQALQHLQEQAENLDSTICPATMESPLVRVALHQVQAEFEPRTWQAFWQTAVDGVPPADVSTRLGMSVESVYQSKSRVLRRLRTTLAEFPK